MMERCPKLSSKKSVGHDSIFFRIQLDYLIFYQYNECFFRYFVIIPT